MDLISVDASACKRDGMCMEVCPLGCIEADAEGLPRPAPEAVCIACGHCVAVCPHGALSNVNVDAQACRPAPKNLPGEEAVRSLMLARRSVRAYKDKPVEPAVLSGLLDTARFAPTAVNTQNVAWVACTDPAKVRQAAGLAVDWLRTSGVYPKMVEAWDKGHDVAMRGAPAFVAAHCPSDYAWGDVDCTIAVSYLELAAASAGLGTCWAGLLTRAAQASPALSGLLGIPEGQTVRAALMLGYPKYRYQLIPPRNEARVSWM
jgi:nitroreductase/NAD-dependent dihydropyrimidine dehydrogenase PreA subunit